MDKLKPPGKKEQRYITIIASFIIVLAIAISILSFLANSTKSRVRQYAEYSVSQNSQRIADEIGTMVEYAICSIQEVSDVIEKYIENDNSVDPNKLIAIVLNNTPFSSIEYITADGMNMTDAGEMFDASDREYYIQGMAGKTGIWINYTPKYSDEALLNFYTPLYCNGEIIGVLTGLIKGEENINPIIKSSFFENDIRGILCDENGVVITSTGRLKYGDVLSGLQNNLGTTENERENYRKRILEDEKINYFLDQDGQALSSICEVKETGWFVLQIVPGKSLSAVIGQFSNESTLALIGIITLFLIIIVQIIISNKKRIEFEQNYSQAIEEINDSLEKEKRVIEKLHETLGSGAFEIQFDEMSMVSSCKLSDELKRLLGYRNKDDLFNTIDSWKKIFHIEKHQEIVDQFRKAAKDYRDETIFDFDYEAELKSGETKWFRATGRFSRRSNGSPMVFYGLMIDIDQAKKNAEKLEKDKLRLVNSLKEQIRLEEIAKEEEKKKETQLAILLSMSEMYFSMHLVDLMEDTYVEYRSDETIRDLERETIGAEAQMKEIINNWISPDYKEEALNFISFHTLSDRMGNKKVIYTELESIHNQRLIVEFIKIDMDDNQKLRHVMFTTNLIS